MRSSNRRLVLQHLIDDSPLSRAELARRTELTPATVSVLAAELESSGLVTRAGTRRDVAQVGKPPVMLEICAVARSVVAIDLSDPLVVRSAVVDLGGHVVSAEQIDTGQLTGDDLVVAVECLAARAIESSDSPVLGVGVATPGVVTDEGTVAEAAHFGWRDLDLGSRLAAALDHPVHVINDANAAAIAEFTRGDHEGSNLAVVKIGSGVGAGFVLNGRPFHGERAAAGEIGHLVVEPGGPLCECGHRGCLETFVATPRLLAASDGPAARRAAAERLGVALSSIVAILDIDEILISGSRELLGDDFCELATTSLRRRCLETVAASVSVRYTALGEDIVMLGAVGLVLNQELGVG
jgi:predicted NBD/HSP70 family sugar kinase